MPVLHSSLSYALTPGRSREDQHFDKGPNLLTSTLIAIDKVIYPNMTWQLIEAEWRIYASVTLTTIGSNNGLSPGRRQAIIRTNAGMLLMEPLGTNFSEFLIKIHSFSFKKMYSVSMC